PLRKITRSVDDETRLTAKPVAVPLRHALPGTSTQVQTSSGATIGAPLASALASARLFVAASSPAQPAANTSSAVTDARRMPSKLLFIMDAAAQKRPGALATLSPEPSRMPRMAAFGIRITRFAN